ncbi:MAG: chemoreceptor glutamine deamidase CheD [Pseudomonadota bacterium]|jgi:chemotaxis protein CheD
MSDPIHQAPSENFYFESAFNSQAAKILPGEYHVTNQNIVLVTLLGSCVTACIRDPLNGIGGMNHFLLPDTSNKQGPGSDSARYGAYAMELLINQLTKMGAARRRLEAKVFGGANVLSGLAQNLVGKRNSEFVLEFLHTEGIPLLAQDLGGKHARKVAYFPATGEARLKRLVEAPPETLLDAERRYRKQISDGPIAGDIELFD